MKIFKYILRFFRNRYVITTMALAAWLLFFDKNDIFSQIDRHREVKKLQNEADYFRSEVAKNKEEAEELQNNPKLLEKFTREHYLMKRDSEDIYIIVEDTVK